MIFKQIEEVLDGRKTQTRRICKPHEWLSDDKQTVYATGKDGKQRVKWQVKRQYPVIPKMYQASVGRIQIDAIRCEPLLKITEDDAIAEGIWPDQEHPEYWRTSAFDGWSAFPRLTYMYLWERINGEGSWRKDPLVWVITFHVVVQDGTTT